ncbi:MAG TPA: cupin domain-containing protein [Alphaproteobacteria bacterium]
MAKTTTNELLVKGLDAAKWKNIPAGFRIYTLFEDAKTGASIALFECPKGVGVPVRHTHASNQFMYCLKGRNEYTATGLVLEPGTFYMNPKGHPHGPTIAHEDSLLIEIYDGPHYFKRPAYHAADTVGRIAGGGRKKRKRPTVKQKKKRPST